MRGLDPPTAVNVVQDNGEGEGLGQARGQPLVAHPQGFQRLWMDTGAREDRRLVLWAPVPKPGCAAGFRVRCCAVLR